MFKKRIFQLISIALISCIIVIPVTAAPVSQVIKQDIVQPMFTNIILFQNGFNISSTGKVSVSVYLTAQNVDSVKVDANLQQYRNGAWITIKSWTKTSAGTNAGLSGTYYVAKGYSYRIVSNGFVYKGSKMIETTTYTSDTKKY